MKLLDDVWPFQQMTLSFRKITGEIPVRDNGECIQMDMWVLRSSDLLTRLIVIYCCYKQSFANTSLFLYGITTSWSRLKWFNHEQMFLTVVLCSPAIKPCNKRQIFLQIKLLWAPPAASRSATKSRRPNTTTIWQKEHIYHLQSCKISLRI